MLTSFAGSDFDAAKLIDGAEMAKHARQMADSRVKHTRALSEILTPEQRTKYADLLEKRSGGDER
jgi:Spy/CpxP family protein refolding chaperone